MRLLWLAIGYVFLPFDLIPDFVAVIGFLGDATVISVPVIAALTVVLKEVVDYCQGGAKGG